jgi:2,3-diketo-5-methylthio-1-phosphopentane phosphatase
VPAVPIVVTDFDGTLAELDVGDALCERYADPAWFEVERRLRRGELSLPEAQRQMWALLRMPLSSLREAARAFGKLRAGSDALFEAAQHGRIELVLASGGFDFYIEALLGERMGLLRAAYYNGMRDAEPGLTPIFPHAELACARCAVCKGLAIQKHLQHGRRLVFCGDGFSDRCAAGVAPELFAVRDSPLAQHCRTHRIAHTEFDDFREVLAALG